MTEYEINLAVAEKLGLTHEVTRYGVVTRESNKEQWCEFDPCNNAQQAWEIMLANDIGITKCLRSDDYCAYRGLWGEGESFNPEHLTCNSEFFFNSKPFVAAMLLFLEI